MLFYTQWRNLHIMWTLYNNFTKIVKYYSQKKYINHSPEVSLSTKNISFN